MNEEEKCAFAYYVRKNGIDGLDEIFVPIVEFDNYEISNNGIIRKRNNGRILSITMNKNGFRYVTLNYNGIRKKYTVCLLEKITFR